MSRPGERYYSFRLVGNGFTAPIPLAEAICKQYPTLFSSMKQVRRLVDNGLVRVNGCYQDRASYPLVPGSLVEFLQIDLQKPCCDVLYEDEDLMVINKSPQVTSEKEELSRLLGKKVFPVHRLDKLTSGILLLAKNAQMEELLFQLFKERKIEKGYLAVVDGRPRVEKGKITAPLAIVPPNKHASQGQSIFVKVDSEGKPSETHFETLCSSRHASLLLVKPITGRTHQIRVHMKYIGNPILGDTHYTQQFSSSLMVGRLLLHAYSIKFIDPRSDQGSNQERTFVAPLERLFEDSCKQLFGEKQLLSILTRGLK